ncbi:hypothetical protein JFK97_10885 [Chromobacterium phragmitis]|uniref:hypothetical protein n=1 Tax=Chromobacterium amazonense TaxID=1382803 RepID=UPI0021B77887|nr:hypothetical protein [Chromobacterium amazonense]MBM2884892.1 hypothetical protein [Chromobacterium amazonense]MDE1714762.1 hypothetical protein [Chromobacterium amazonense]
MKLCTVWGEMSSDSAADQYPTVNVCDDCFKADDGDEDSQIVSHEGKYDPAYGEECHFCGKTEEEEREGA